MRKRIIIIAVLVISAFLTIFLTSKITAYYVDRQYHINEDPYYQGLMITKFSVRKEDVKLSMFKDSFYVYVYIKGIMYDNSQKPYISYIHKSERIEKEGEESVKIIELTPIVKTKPLSLSHNYIIDFDRMFKYKLRCFRYDYGYNKYIFKCGDFEQTVYMNHDK